MCAQQNDHCFGSKFGPNRLGLPPFSRTSAKKYLLNSQLASSETENETGAETQPAVVSGNAPVNYRSIFPPVPSNSPTSLCKSQLDPVPFFFLQKLSSVFTHFEWEWVQTFGTKISHHKGIQYNQ